MRVPMAVPYAALPLGFAIMLLFTLEEALAFVARLRRRPSDASEAPKEA